MCVFTLVEIYKCRELILKKYFYNYKCYYQLLYICKSFSLSHFSIINRAHIKFTIISHYFNIIIRNVYKSNQTVNNKTENANGGSSKLLRLGPIGSFMRINTVLNYKAVVAEKCSMDSVRWTYKHYMNLLLIVKSITIYLYAYICI